ncbi:hypothetical protein THAOC_33076 [Thalassiosira oceanica]|uniref:Uncharacterized protein n=1 Tax=Thalassiosira oceanica TaxID=159749 RepID=K0R5W5_THAOC|nr:hypothetical protein THAOC_33076 [Thalassiosira oceanica]|eukprot:EJK48155.1 hypothetical protein THAOC_33076 [Thalassiosira oceanica]
MQAERTEIIQSLEYVDETVCPCPLLVTEDFMRQRNIDLVVHGFADAADEQRQRKEFFEIAIRENKFSTSDIIAQIERCKDDAPVRNGINPKWFGASLAAATDKSPHIQYDPFPLNLRVSIDIHLRKAARRRTEALAVSREAAGSAIYDSVLSSFRAFSQEGEFHFDTSKHMLRDRFLHSCNLPENFDLAMLHTSDEPGLKDTMLLALMDNFRAFQREFDVFAREVACVKVASMADEPVNELYYQSFPCVRIIRPGDFSHPCSINIYVPLTKIEGTSSLFLESRPGSEDWHPIEGTYGFGKHFAGAVCNHWTPENNTNFTRVSFDFRIIPGHLFRALDCGSDKSGDAKDVYRQREGYYSRCVLDESTSSWIRDDDGPLNTPDSRCGFPWTARKEGR